MIYEDSCQEWKDNNRLKQPFIDGINTLFSLPRSSYFALLMGIGLNILFNCIELNCTGWTPVAFTTLH